MNTYNDLKMLERMRIENQIKNFTGEIQIIPIGVSGEFLALKKDVSELKKKLQQQERNARKIVKKKKQFPKSEVMKAVVGHSKGIDGYMLFLECGHQKQSAVKEVGKIPLTSKCFECLKEKQNGK